MTLNYPYDCTLEEHKVSAMYDRIMNLVKTRHPDARYACFHVNFDEAKQDRKRRKYENARKVILTVIDRQNPLRERLKGELLVRGEIKSK